MQRPWKLVFWLVCWYTPLFLSAFTLFRLILTPQFSLNPTLVKWSFFVNEKRHVLSANIFSKIAATLLTFTTRKVVCIRRFSCPYFPTFGLNMEIYGVIVWIQFKLGEKQTGQTLYSDNFDAVPEANKRLPVWYYQFAQYGLAAITNWLV